MNKEDFAEKLSKLSDENHTYLFLAAHTLIHEEFPSQHGCEG